jgi:hypothetical protein
MNGMRGVSPDQPRCLSGIDPSNHLREREIQTKQQNTARERQMKTKREKRMKTGKSKGKEIDKRQKTKDKR